MTPSPDLSPKGERNMSHHFVLLSPQWGERWGEGGR